MRQRTALKNEDAASANGATSFFHIRIRRTVIFQAACNQIQRLSDSFHVSYSYELVSAMHKIQKVFLKIRELRIRRLIYTNV